LDENLISADHTFDEVHHLTDCTSKLAPEIQKISDVP